MRNKIAIAVVLLLCSCSPKIVEHIRTEYVYRDRVQVDTTFIHDSTYIREFIKGDTVRITEYKDRFVYEYKYLTKTDTVLVRDSVAVEKIKEVKVEKPLSWGKRAKLGLFWWLVAGLAGFGIYTFRKPIWAFIKSLLHI